MCGFLLYIKKNKSLSKKEIKKINLATELLLHRGPDYKKKIIKKNLFLFHCRLNIQDLYSRSNQPMIKNIDNNKFYLLYNGEIYNFKKIKRNLQKKIKFKTTGDTEVLLNYLIINKNKFLNYSNLKGMFSFILLKEKYHNIKIYFARDHFGQKPLYYLDDDKKIILSSEIKPILSLMKNNSNVNQQICKEYFLKNEYFFQRKTFFNNINQILPGECGVITNKKIFFYKYFTKHNILKNNKITNKVTFLKLFKKNILEHTIADKKFAISLSSGIDSQSIAHTLFSNSKVNYEIISYTIDFENGTYEFNDAKKFVEAYQKKIKKILITEDFVINNFEKYVIKNEGPIGGIMLFGMFKLCETVKKDGFDILFSGFGLDEALGSYKSMRSELITKNKFSLLDNTSITNSHYLKNNSFYEDEIRGNYFFKYRIPRSTHFMDRVSMSSSIEMRLPFLDKDFVMNACSINISPNKIDKYLLRNYMQKNSKYKKNWLVPKKHVTHPQNIWLRSGKLSDFTHYILKDKFLYNKYSYLSKTKILNDWIKFKDNQINSGYTFWQLLNLFFIAKIK